MLKSFNKLIFIYRVRLLYFIVMSSIFVTIFVINIVFKIFFDEETFLLSLWPFMGFISIFQPSFLVLIIMGTTCTITVGSYICENESQKKAIKKYAFFGILIPSIVLVTMILLLYYMVFSTVSDTWVIIIGLVLFALINSTLLLLADSTRKGVVNKVFKKGFVCGDYVIPFEFISSIDYIFDPESSKRVILKIYINDKKSIKIYSKPILHELKEVYPNIKLFNKKENRYIEETNLNK